MLPASSDQAWISSTLSILEPSLPCVPLVMVMVPVLRPWRAASSAWTSRPLRSAMSLTVDRSALARALRSALSCARRAVRSACCCAAAGSPFRLASDFCCACSSASTSVRCLPISRLVPARSYPVVPSMLVEVNVVSSPGRCTISSRVATPPSLVSTTTWRVSGASEVSITRFLPEGSGVAVAGVAALSPPETRDSPFWYSSSLALSALTFIWVSMRSSQLSTEGVGSLDMMKVSWRSLPHGAGWCNGKTSGVRARNAVSTAASIR